MDNHDNSVIAGRNAVLEALRADRPIAAIYVQRGEKNGSIVSIIAKAKKKQIQIKEVDGKKLDFMCGHAVHQGVCASAAVKNFAELDDLFSHAEEKGEPPFFIICDEISDPHNLGAIIRTAECAGAHGVIVPERRNVGLTFAVGKASAGAAEHLPVARVKNLADTIEKLKKRGVWIYTADMDGKPWYETDFSGAAALVVGSEGDGVSRLIKEKSDFIVSLPVKGQINSLNASVAAGIIAYEIARQRSRLSAVNR